MRLAAILTLGLFAFVLGMLVQQRFEVGDVYPRYSSLRSDPLGAKALFDTLESLGRKPERNYLPLDAVKPGKATFLLLGIPQGRLADPDSELRKLVKAGTTLVVGISGCATERIRSLDLRIQCADDLPSFASPSWTPLALDAEGRIIAAVRGQLIVMRAGLLSNRTLARDRDSELVSIILDRNDRVIFDEQHLGISDPVSIGALLQRYRLQPFIAACLLLFGLFVWKNATAFLPPVPVKESEVAGKDATAGIANLLRRAIPASELMSICIAEWSKSARNAARLAEARAIAAANPNAVDSYKAIARMLADK